MKLFINTESKNAHSLVISQSDLRNENAPQFIFGDKLQVRVGFTDQDGQKPEWFGRSDTQIQIVLGLPKTRQLFTQNIMTFDGEYYTTTLDCFTSSLQDYMGTSARKTAYLEVNQQDYPQGGKTLLQTPTTILNQLLS